VLRHGAAIPLSASRIPSRSKLFPFFPFCPGSCPGGVRGGSHPFLVARLFSRLFFLFQSAVACLCGSRCSLRISPFLFCLRLSLSLRVMSSFVELSPPSRIFFRAFADAWRASTASTPRPILSAFCSRFPRHGFLPTKRRVPQVFLSCVSLFSLVFFFLLGPERSSPLGPCSSCRRASVTASLPLYGGTCRLVKATPLFDRRFYWLSILPLRPQLTPSSVDHPLSFRCRSRFPIQIFDLASAGGAPGSLRMQSVFCSDFRMSTAIHFSFFRAVRSLVNLSLFPCPFPGISRGYSVMFS